MVDFQTPDFQMITVKSHLYNSKFNFLNNSFFVSGYHRVNSLIAIRGNLFSSSITFSFLRYKCCLIIFHSSKKCKNFGGFIECLD